mmetsp:Transcript_2325/g.7113  ORF Transcript_2325/g.7113 Transcript_2325/m.7113 type:complete len:240 (+) Transcript_2325:3570-4289(+)
MPSIVSRAPSISHPPGPVIVTFPESSTSMDDTPVFSTIFLIVSPPLPITLPINFGLTDILEICGAYAPILPLGAGLDFSISPKTCTIPSLASSSALRMTSKVIPSTLISIWNAVNPSESPAHLKSMSPKASSDPRISVSMIASGCFSSPRINPMATPATFLLIGTPASCNAKHPPQTVAMLELPLLSVTVLSILIVNGKSSPFGIIGNNALSAKFPCPISRRLAPPTRPHSPTELGGKK